MHNKVSIPDKIRGMMIYGGFTKADVSKILKCHRITVDRLLSQAQQMPDLLDKRFHRAYTVILKEHRKGVLPIFDKDNWELRDAAALRIQAKLDLRGL